MINFNRSFNTPALDIPAHIVAAQAALHAPTEEAWLEAQEMWEALVGAEDSPWEWEEDNSPVEWEGW